jgi:ribosomal protein L40E
VRHGWAAAIAGARTRNAGELAGARAIGIAARDRAAGKEQEDARGLAVYCDSALNQIESGVRERSPLMRMLSRQPRDVAMKICPECAESVQPAARICRFCGYEFAPRPDA